jgi:hypothetical protein
MLQAACCIVSALRCSQSCTICKIQCRNNTQQTHFKGVTLHLSARIIRHAAHEKKTRQTVEVRITYAYHFMGGGGGLQGTKVGCKINDDLKLKASSKIKFSRKIQGALVATHWPTFLGVWQCVCCSM